MKKKKSVLSILKNEKCWIKGELARNKDGDRVEPCDSDAVCFCVAGALMKLHGYMSDDYFQGRQKLLSVTNHSSLPNINDAPDMTFTKLKELIRKAGV